MAAGRYAAIACEPAPAPFPGEQFVDLRVRVIGHAADDVAKPSLGVDVVQASGLDGCGANIGSRAKQESWDLTWITRPALHSKSQVRFCFDAKLGRFELTLPDPVHEFDAGDRRCSSPKCLKPSIGPSRNLIDR